jgi:hypothetical protein
MGDLGDRPRAKRDIVEPTDLESDGLDYVPGKRIEEAELHRRLARVKWLYNEPEEEEVADSEDKTSLPARGSSRG